MNNLYAYLAGPTIPDFTSDGSLGRLSVQYDPVARIYITMHGIKDQ